MLTFLILCNIISDSYTSYSNTANKKGINIVIKTITLVNCENEHP